MGKIDLSAAKAAQGAETLAKPSKKKVKTDAKNTEGIKAKVKKAKDAMYLYPPDSDKKKFRAEARRTLAKYEKKLAGGFENPEKRAKLVRIANKWAAGIYSKDSLPELK